MHIGCRVDHYLNDERMQLSGSEVNLKHASVHPAVRKANDSLDLRNSFLCSVYSGVDG